MEAGPSGLAYLFSEGLLEEFPRAADVAVGGLQVADGDAQGEAAAEHGVRDEDLARVVDALEDGFVQPRQFGLGPVAPRGLRAEAEGLPSRDQVEAGLWRSGLQP